MFRYAGVCKATLLHAAPAIKSSLPHQMMLLVADFLGGNPENGIRNLSVNFGNRTYRRFPIGLPSEEHDAFVNFDGMTGTIAIAKHRGDEPIRFGDFIAAAVINYINNDVRADQIDHHGISLVDPKDHEDKGTALEQVQTSTSTLHPFSSVMVARKKLLFCAAQDNFTLGAGQVLVRGSGGVVHSLDGSDILQRKFDDRPVTLVYMGDSDAVAQQRAVAGTFLALESHRAIPRAHSML